MCLREVILSKLRDNSRISNCELYYIAVENNYKPTHAVQVLKELYSSAVILITDTDGKKAQKVAFYVDNKYAKEVRITISLAK